MKDVIEKCMSIVSITIDIAKYPTTKRTSKIQVKKGTCFFTIEKDVASCHNLSQGKSIPYYYVGGPDGKPMILACLDGKELQ